MFIKINSTFTSVFYEKDNKQQEIKISNQINFFGANDEDFSQKVCFGNLTRDDFERSEYGVHYAFTGLKLAILQNVEEVHPIYGLATVKTVQLFDYLAAQIISVAKSSQIPLENGQVTFIFDTKTELDFLKRNLTKHFASLAFVSTPEHAKLLQQSTPVLMLEPDYLILYQQSEELLLSFNQNDPQALFAKDLIKILDLESIFDNQMKKSGTVTLAMQKFNYWTEKLFVRQEFDDIQSYEVPTKLISEDVNVEAVNQRLQDYNQNFEDLDIQYDGRDLMFTMDLAKIMYFYESKEMIKKFIQHLSSEKQIIVVGSFSSHSYYQEYLSYIIKYQLVRCCEGFK